MRCDWLRVEGGKRRSRLGLSSLAGLVRFMTAYVVSDQNKECT